MKALATTGSHEVQAVFTQPDRPAGRDLKLRAAAGQGCGARTRSRPSSSLRRSARPTRLPNLSALKPDVIVVAAYGQILPKAVLSLPPFGCINIHASLLPRHRGASPIHAAILEGDSETGVTIMQMDEGLDTGDILFKVATPIGPDETAGESARPPRSACTECPVGMPRPFGTRRRVTRKARRRACDLRAKAYAQRRRNRLEQAGGGNRKASSRHDAVAGRLHVCHTGGYPGDFENSSSRNLGRRRRTGWNRCGGRRWRHSCCGRKGRNCL